MVVGGLIERRRAPPGRKEEEVSPCCWIHGDGFLLSNTHSGFRGFLPMGRMSFQEGLEGQGHINPWAGHLRLPR